MTDRYCRSCGQTFDLHGHHVIPRSLGGKNGPVIDLCSMDHARAHAGKLDVLPLLSTDEQVECVRIAGTIERAREILTRENRKVATMPVFSEDAA